MNERQVNTTIIIIACLMGGWIGQGYVSELLEHTRQVEEMNRPAAEIAAEQLEAARLETEANRAAADYWNRLRKEQNENPNFNPPSFIPYGTDQGPPQFIPGIPTWGKAGEAKDSKAGSPKAKP